MAENNFTFSFLQLNIIYRDLKPENVVIDHDGHIILADYGLSKMLNKAGDLSSNCCGTINYMAPEVIMADSYGISVDWWSLGVLAVMLMSNRAPFALPAIANRLLTPAQCQEKIAEKIVQEVPCISDRVVGTSRRFCEQLLMRDQNQRLGCREGATEIKRHPFFSGTDWEAFLRKQIEPPYKPRFSSDSDVSYFSPRVTGCQPVDDPNDCKSVTPSYFKGEFKRRKKNLKLRRKIFFLPN